MGKALLYGALLGVSQTALVISWSRSPDMGGKNLGESDQHPSQSFPSRKPQSSRRAHQQGKSSPFRDKAGSQSDQLLAEEGVDCLVGLEVGDLGEDPCANSMSQKVSSLVSVSWTELCNATL